MPSLLIKDLPKTLHEQLKRRAARNHRSATKEALAILEAALLEAPPRPTLEEIRRWQITPKKPFTDAFLKRAKTQGRM
jgi:plasmid stability protein